MVHIFFMIDPQKQLFPYCIVWTILPCITWLLPWVGHAGICDSNGVIYDFLGMHINVGSMAFGKVVKYVRLFPDQQQTYSKGVIQANSKFSRQFHSLCCNNCHHHVADALNCMKFEGRDNWSQFSIWWMCLTRSKYVNWCDIIIVYLPITLIIALILGLVLGLK